MANIVMKAPATISIGAKIISEYGSVTVGAGSLVTVDQRQSAQLQNAGFMPVGVIPAGGTTGQQLSKVDAVDYNLAWAAAA